jgi:hypothetical protein
MVRQESRPSQLRRVEICQEALFEVQTFLKFTEPGVMAAAWDDEGITATGPTSQ